MTPRAWRAAAGAALAAALGCGLPPAPPGPPAVAHDLRVVPGRLDPRRWLESSAKLAGSAGAGPLQPVAAAVVAGGDQLGGFVELGPGECLLALARAARSIDDVDLFVFSDAGELLGADEGPDAAASVLLCPPHPRRMYVSARVMSGTGMLGLGVLPVPDRAADAVARLIRVRGRPGQDTGRLDEWPGLEPRLRERRAKLGSRWEDVRRAVVPLDPHAYASVSATVEAGRCIDVLVAPDEQVSAIDVSVLDTGGRVVARASPQGRDAAAVLCSAETQTVTVMIRPRLAAGAAAVVVSQSPPGASSELGERTWVDGVTPFRSVEEGLRAQRRRLAGAGWGPARPALSGAARFGSPVAMGLSLPLGCTRIDVVAGRPLGAFAAELWTEDGGRLAEARGGETATLFACGPARSAQLEVRALAQPGPFAVEVRPALQAPALLGAYPFAAARVLGRLEASSGPVDLGRAGEWEVVSLGAGQRKALTVPVASQHCVEVYAALDREGAGLGLEVQEGAEAERRTSRGELLVSDLLCAQAEDRVGRIELRLDAGQAKLLLLRRQVPLR